MLLCRQGWMESLGWGPWFLRSGERAGQLEHTPGRTQGIKGRERVQTQAQGWVISIDCASGRTPEDRGGCVCVCAKRVCANLFILPTPAEGQSDAVAPITCWAWGCKTHPTPQPSLPTVNWRLSLLRGCQSMLIRFSL